MCDQSGQTETREWPDSLQSSTHVAISNRLESTAATPDITRMSSSHGLSDEQVSQELKRMVAFIKQEAIEKSREIHIKVRPVDHGAHTSL